MAKLSSDKTYVTVEAGDTLSEIAKTYLGSANKYKTLASINNISNPNLIYIGQKIYLKSSGGSSSTSAGVDSNKVEITQFGQQATDENTLFVTWKWSRKNTESFKVVWNYGTGDGVAFVGQTDDVKIDKELESGGYTGMSRQSTYPIPGNAVSVQVRILPISEKKKSGSKEVSYWEAKWSEIKTWRRETLLTGPSSAPTVTIEGKKLTVSLEGLEKLDADGIEFEIVKDNKAVFKTAKAEISTGRAEYSCDVDDGGEYKARCRSYVNDANGSTTSPYSEWTAYSSNVSSRPATPSEITVLRADERDANVIAVYLEWGESSTATGYEIQYSQKKEYFDKSSSDVKSYTQENKATSAYITDIEIGKEWFFRVRAKNGDFTSEWTEIKSLTIGTTPTAPTTWSSVTTAKVGETVNLYWVHNTEDGSSETYGQLEVYVDDVKLVIPDQKKSTDKDKRDETSVYVLDTSNLSGGATIEWRVRTAGVTKVYGEWSIMRTIEVYSEPSFEKFEITDVDGNSLATSTSDDGTVTKYTVTSFPFRVYALPKDTKDNQAPIGYYLSVVSNESYETVDSIGNFKMVNIGDYVYSKYFDTANNAIEIVASYTGLTVDAVKKVYNDAVTEKVDDPIAVASGVLAGKSDREASKIAELWNSARSGASLLVELHPGNIDLEDGRDYTVTCMVSMNSGLTATMKVPLTVSWTDELYEPNMELGIDTETYTAYIRPYCQKRRTVAYLIDTTDVKVATDSINDMSILTTDSVDSYTVGDGLLVHSGQGSDGKYSLYGLESPDSDYAWLLDISEREYASSGGEPLVSSDGTQYVTSGGEIIYAGVESYVTGKDDEGYDTYDYKDVLFCYVEEITPITDVYLSVYRREFDGSFVEIASDLDGAKATTVSDPHTALDYARYRIVAKHKGTGAISHYDPPSYYVGGKSVIIQWDEEWSWFETDEENPLEQPPWTGSMLKLPYNIDVSDSNSPDVSFVEYVGRTSPVSYYGTHIGQTATWNVVIERDDEETLYALRRLARWMGDAYVREPSGSGYWANVTVSFSQKHLDLTIPVTISLKRVEGGI